MGLVVVIWGVIAFRIFSAISNEPESLKTPGKLVFSTLDKVERDTFSIKADYRDPFLGTYSSKPKNREKKTQPTPSKTFDIDVRYTGSMVNHNTGKRIYFVSINGNQHLLEKGQKADGVSVISGGTNRVTVRYKGILKTIDLQP